MVMAMVLVLMVVALCIVVPGLTATATMLKVNQELAISTKAYYAAKAGIEDFCWKFSNDRYFTLANPYTLPDLNGMAVTVSQVSGDVTDPLSPVCVIQSIAESKDTGIEKAKIFTKLEVTWIWMPGTAGNDPVTGTPGFWTVATPGTEGFWTPGTDEIPSVTGYPFDYAVATTDGLLWIKNNANVNSIPNPPNGEADVFANGALRKDTATGFIYGTGYYTEGTTDCSNITGGCQKKTEGIAFQTLDESWYWEQAKLGKACPALAGWPNTALPTTYGAQTYIYDGEKNAIKLKGTTNWTNISTVKNPTYLGGAGNISYIDGNLELEKNFVMKGVLWVNGYISVEGLTIINTDPYKQSYLLAHGAADHGITLVTNSKIYATNNNLNLMSDNGTITLESGIDGPTVSAPVLLGILYAPNGPIIINSNSDAVTSAILGKSVTLDANVTVNYDINLRNNPPEGFELNVTYTPGTGFWTSGTPAVPSVWMPRTAGTDPMTGASGFWTPEGVKIVGYSGP